MASAEDALVGRVLGSRYRVVRQLGRGGMGSVYEAIDVDLDRRVALKIILPELARDPVLIERFRREVVTAARIHHPNVVQVIDFGRTPGEPPFLVMELLSGRTLVARLKRGRLDARRAVRITMQILSGLDTAHAAGVVHRDLKPENVFLVALEGGGEVVKLLDFGLAKLLDGEAQSRLTKTGVLVGTPRYAAPEQVKGSRHVDARTDVYAAGVLLYAMLTGRPPFTANLPQLWTDVLQNEPTHPRLVVPELPPELVAIVQKAMRKRPDERYPSARAMAEALAPFASSSRSRSLLPAEASLHAGRVSRASRAPRSSRLLPVALLLLAVGAAAALAGGGAIVWRLASRSDDSAPSSVKTSAGGPKPAPALPMVPSAPAMAAPAPAPVQVALPPPQPAAPSTFAACDDYERRACDCPRHPSFCAQARNNLRNWRLVSDTMWRRTTCENALVDANRRCARSAQLVRPPPRHDDDDEGTLIPPW